MDYCLPDNLTNQSRGNPAHYKGMRMNEKAVDKFMEIKLENEVLISKISRFVANHHNVAPDDINYGHVGDALHVQEKLNDIIEFLGINKEF